MLIFQFCVDSRPGLLSVVVARSRPALRREESRFAERSRKETWSRRRNSRRGSSATGRANAIGSLARRVLEFCERARRAEPLAWVDEYFRVSADSYLRLRRLVSVSEERNAADKSVGTSSPCRTSRKCQGTSVTSVPQRARNLNRVELLAMRSDRENLVVLLSSVIA